MNDAQSTTPILVDAHTHLDHYDAATLSQVIDEINAQQVLTVAVATDPPSWQRTIEIAARSPWIIPTFGIHPWKAHLFDGRWEELESLIAASVMLGEVGLDFHWVEDRTTDDAQRHVLCFFLRAAAQQHKIVNLHTKGAEAEILDALAVHGVERAIVHWYSGPPATAQAYADRGAFFTFGVELLRSEHIQHLAAALPLDQLLTETDGPSGLEWLGGGVGMPHHIGDVVAMLARLRGLHEVEMRQIVVANMQRLMGDDPLLRPWTALMASHL